MMRKKRILKYSLLVLLLIIVLTVGLFVIKGYQMYRSALASCPIAEKVASLQSQKNYTSLDKLPDMYVNAVVAVEDHRFYSHGAIDLISIGRAVWIDMTTLSLKEGGSTITQQLVKNIYFTQERKLERKVAEVFMAYELEKVCEKDEILEMYVNTIYFGSGYYSIYDASMGYFDTLPENLSDYQATMLAGLPQAPSVYSPDNNPDLAVQRQAQVLAKMVKHKYISQEKADEILSVGV